MRLDYKSVFDRRGNTYDEAMRRFPRARWQEIENVFSRVDKSQLTSVLDIPSGGGYLALHLPSHVEVHECDPSQQFATADSGVQNVDLEAPCLPPANYDLIVNLAAIHHIHNKQRFLKCLTAAVRPGALIVIGDVQSTSPIARFLDDFVGQHNGTGHDGEYLSGDPATDFGWQSGELEVVQHAVMPCNWTLPTVNELTAFCKLLFNVQAATDTELLRAMESYVGIDRVEGVATLKWELFYYVFRRVKS